MVCPLPASPKKNQPKENTPEPPPADPFASEFPARGQPDNDREYRHPRTRADRSTKSGAAKARRSVLEGPGPRLHAADDWDDLPRLQDLIDGVDRFTRYYFQLGFVPKHQFPDRLRNDHRSVNLFLLMSILSISARLSPSLKARYGTGVKAAEFFMDRAAGIAIGEVYQEPTLERCQAFYLLSIAQQGSALRNKSYVRRTTSLVYPVHWALTARRSTWALPCAWPH